METLLQEKLIIPDPTSQERVLFLSQQKGIDPTIAAVDLSMVKLKLQDSEEGLGWTQEQCEAAEVEYKRYLHLCKIHGKGIVPNKVQDQMWHYHILDTRAYAKDCQTMFGYFLHHFPYFGMRGADDARQLEESFYRTKDRYLAAFGEPMSREESMKCWHNCQSRCWNACSNK